MSPADRRTTSPATSSRIGISSISGGVVARFRRSTVAVVRTIAFKASAALPERYSWTKRMMPLARIMTVRMITLVGSGASPFCMGSQQSVNALIRPRTISTMMKGFLKADMNWISACGRRSWATSFAPSLARRSDASRIVRPLRWLLTLARVMSISFWASRTARMDSLRLSFFSAFNAEFLRMTFIFWSPAALRDSDTSSGSPEIQAQQAVPSRHVHGRFWGICSLGSPAMLAGHRQHGGPTRIVVHGILLHAAPDGPKAHARRLAKQRSDHAARLIDRQHHPEFFNRVQSGCGRLIVGMPAHFKPAIDRIDAPIRLQIGKKMLFLGCCGNAVPLHGKPPAGAVGEGANAWKSCERDVHGSPH